jgi:hypothetical protein
MATPAIGTLTVGFLEGVIHVPSMEVERLERAGVDGFGARQGPTRGKPTTLKATTYVADATAAAAHILAAGALRSTLVTVSDEFGLNWTNCLIEDVRLTQPMRFVMVNGAGKVQVTIEFDVIQRL